MGYSAGFLHDIIQPLNRKEAVAGKYGLDSAGIECTGIHGRFA